MKIGWEFRVVGFEEVSTLDGLFLRDGRPDLDFPPYASWWTLIPFLCSFSLLFSFLPQLQSHQATLVTIYFFILPPSTSYFDVSRALRWNHPFPRTLMSWEARWLLARTWIYFLLFFKAIFFFSPLSPWNTRSLLFFESIVFHPFPVL